MVTIFSALSSSSEARMRLSRSLCGAAFLAAAGLLETAFLAAGFLTAFLTVLEDFVALLVVLAAGFLPAAGLAVLRVRAEILLCQEARFSMASCAAPRASARSSVELSWERGPSKITSDGAEPSRRAWPRRRARGACKEASTEPGRRTTAMGTMAAISCQRRQRENCSRLSLPISHTNVTCGKRCSSARTVSTVKQV